MIRTLYIFEGSVEGTFCHRLQCGLNCC